MPILKLRTLLTTAILLTISANTAFSAWELIASFPDDRHYEYIEDSRITRKGDTVTFWQKADSSEHGYITAKVEINCKTIMRRELGRTDYDRNGHILKTYKDIIPWHDIVPATVNDAIYKRLCKQSKQ